jgi:hypothetical protein
MSRMFRVIITYTVCFVLPLDAPPLDVKTETSQLTFDPSQDQYPQNTPPIESASREGRVPGRERNR